jgi:hypothetical protein
MNTSPLFAASLLALLITLGCASINGGQLVPGRSTAAEVEATMGNPAERPRWATTRWWYSRHRWEICRDRRPDNIVKRVEQRLTEI